MFLPIAWMLVRISSTYTRGRKSCFHIYCLQTSSLQISFIYFIFTLVYKQKDRDLLTEITSSKKSGINSPVKSIAWSSYSVENSSVLLAAAWRKRNKQNTYSDLTQLLSSGSTHIQYDMQGFFQHIKREQKL
jgi:hypothetical protein